MKLKQSQPEALSEILLQYMRAMHLGASHNTRRIFEAWDEASGAQSFTLRRFFRDGTLYITLGSSVARSRLEMQKDDLILRINTILTADPLFIKDDGRVGLVQKLVLK